MKLLSRTSVLLAGTALLAVAPVQGSAAASADATASVLTAARSPRLPLPGLPSAAPPTGFTAPSTVLATLALPIAGSYTLDHIMRAPAGQVQDSDGSLHPLAAFTTGKITLFSFIYTACSDALGCPLALATMHTLKAAIAQDPHLREQVRFVSMSFDPLHDTAPVMRSYGGLDARPAARPRWFFLTSQSASQLAPVLAGFDQDRRDVPVSQGGAGMGAATRPVLSHLLKIYLLDGAGEVREIYSPAYLQPEAMLNDIRTLAGAALAGARRQ